MTHPPLDEPPWQEPRAVAYGRANQASSHYRGPRQGRPVPAKTPAMAHKMSNRRRFWLFTMVFLLALVFGAAMFGAVFAGQVPVAEGPGTPERVQPQVTEQPAPVAPTTTPRSTTRSTTDDDDQDGGDQEGGDQGGGDPPPRTTAPDAPPPKTAAPGGGGDPDPTAAAETVTYQNCNKARRAGAAPLYQEDPGYSAKLDKDGDGVACEDDNG